MENIETLKSRLAKKTIEIKRLRNSLRYHKNIEKSREANNTATEVQSTETAPNNPDDSNEAQINVCDVL